MRRTFGRYSGLALLGWLLLAGGPRAYADDAMTWFFKNTINQLIAVQLYSESRPGHTWPAVDTMLLIPANGAVYHSEISCLNGEKICYGGWISGSPNGTYWGSGYHDAEHCTNCCFVCGRGNTDILDLQ